MAEERAVTDPQDDSKKDDQNTGEVEIHDVADKPHEETEEKGDTIDQVAEKVEEGKAIDKANEELKAENEIKDEKSEGPTKGERTLSAIGYILFFCILPLVLKQKSEFCQFHGKQSLVMCICYLVFWFFGFIHWVLALIIVLVYLVLIILGIVNSVEGKMWEVPLVGKIAKKLNFD